MTGETVLHYRIEGPLGKGGMGVVFKATDLKLLRPVALKFIPAEFSEDSDARERFLREARAASTIDHPNVGTIFGVETAPDGHQFIVMAYYEGETLTQSLARGPLPLEQAIPLVRQVALGLAEAHQRGIVHRDIKPSNVILSRQGVVKIVDFGLASVSGADRLTHTGARMGTPHYMSPEQALGETVDHRTDLWSLGVLLFEMLAGDTPFGAPSIPAALYRIVHTELSTAALPANVQPLLTKALAKDRDLRFQSARDFVLALDAVVPPSSFAPDASTILLPAAAPTATAVSSPASRRPKRWLAAAAIAAAVALLAFAAYRFLPLTRTPAEKSLAAAHPSAHQEYLRALDLLDRWEKDKNLPTAIALLENAVRLDPNFALAHARLAEGYRLRASSAKDPAALDLALRQAQRAAALSPDLPPVQTVLGRVYSALGQNDLALAALTRSLQLDPNDGDTHAALGRQLEKLGRLPEAEQAYARSLALQPDSWRNLYVAGNFYFRQGDFPKAIAHWQRVTELTPDNSPAYTNLGAALLEAGRLPEAQASYQRAIALQPNYVAYMNLGKVYYLQSHYAQAARMFEKAAAMNADDYIPVGNLAAAQSLLPEARQQSLATFRRAAALAEPAAQRARTDPDIFANLAIYYAKLSQPDLAQRRLATALALAPKNNALYASAAEVSEILGRRDDALRYVRQAIDLGYPRGSLRRNPELTALLADPQLAAILK
jgi:serine/threonine-protein kinase